MASRCAHTYRQADEEVGPLESHLDECEPSPRVALPTDTLMDIGCSPPTSLSTDTIPHGAVLGHLRDFVPGVYNDEQVLAIGATSDNTTQLAATTHEVSDRNNLPTELHVV